MACMTDFVKQSAFGPLDMYTDSSNSSNRTIQVTEQYMCNQTKDWFQKLNSKINHTCYLVACQI